MTFVKLKITAILLVAFFAPLSAQQLTWQPATPAPNTLGQVEKIANRVVSGAVNAVTPHPEDPKILFIGAVNGGIWKTENALNSTPQWKSLTDDQDSLSIGALEFDTTNTEVLVAGIGQYSSIGEGGDRTGILLTRDSGQSWTSINGVNNKMSGKNVSGIAIRENTIVVAVQSASNFSHLGIWRSTDLGNHWDQVSGPGGSALPNGRSYDLVLDDRDGNSRLYTNAGTHGLFQSNDFGLSWQKISNPMVDSLVSNASKIEFAVGKNGSLFVATVGGSGRLSSVWNTQDFGGHWKMMDLPFIDGAGIHPGRQGNTHLSLAADPENPNVVYLGGDRQDRRNNAIGSKDYSGRLVRGDLERNTAQWVHITHKKNVPGLPGGGTNNASSPHADSRDMDFAANGVLLEGDDGGIYKRMNPSSENGDWFSLNGDLQITEFHSVAWDSISDVVVGGAQDTGTPEQVSPGTPMARSISTADGGVVAISDSPTLTKSVRFTSNQFLGGFRRRVYDSSNQLQFQVFPNLTSTSGPSLQPQFYTPIAVNPIQTNNLIIGASNGVYESTNQGATVRRIHSAVINGFKGTPIVYGTVDAPNGLYIGSGSRVFIRQHAHPNQLQQSLAFSGGNVVDIAVNSNNFSHAFVADKKSVFSTNNAGAIWQDITTNLSSFDFGEIKSIAFASRSGGEIYVGTKRGVFFHNLQSTSGWTKLGVSLPNVPVTQLEYEEVDDLLLAGTLGRGAWLLRFSEHDGETIPTSFREEKSEMVELVGGVIIDSDTNDMYLMKPTQGIASVKISTGDVIWESDNSDKPIGLAKGKLVTQKSNNKNVMTFASLDTKTGELTAENAIPLNANVIASVDQTLNGQFWAKSFSARDGGVQLAWQYEERVMQGRPDRRDLGPEDGLQNPGGIPAINREAEEEFQTRVSNGAFDIDVESGDFQKSESNIDVQRSTSSGIRIAANVQPNDFDGIGDQFLSADGKHFMVSELAGELTDFTPYKWSIFEETGDKIGEVESHLATAPFYVFNTTLIYVTEPYDVFEKGEQKSEPRKVRAIDLETGEEKWSTELRDTTYRGPYPG